MQLILTQNAKTLILASRKNGRKTNKDFSVRETVLQISSYAHMEILINNEAAGVVVLGLRKILFCLKKSVIWNN